MVCLSLSNWVHTSLSKSGADEADHSSFYVNSSSDSPEASLSHQTDSRFFRNTGNNWEYAELRESFLDQESMKRQ